MCQNLHAEELQATVSEGLAQGPYMVVIELDSNPRPFGRKASSLPMRHHAPQHTCIHITYSYVHVTLMLARSLVQKHLYTVYVYWPIDDIWHLPWLCKSMHIVERQ